MLKILIIICSVYLVACNFTNCKIYSKNVKLYDSTEISGNIAVFFETKKSLNTFLCKNIENIKDFKEINQTGLDAIDLDFGIMFNYTFNIDNLNNLKTNIKMKSLTLFINNI